jgi:hypothetical protein
MLEPTLDAIAEHGLLVDVGTLHLDRGYDSGAVRERLRAAGVDQFEIQLRGTKVAGVKTQPVRLGLRWIVEATNTWWSNYGQLRRNTDRRNRHRHAALCLATVVLIVGRLLDHRDRWSPSCALSARVLRRRTPVTAAVVPTFDPHCCLRTGPRARGVPDQSQTRAVSTRQIALKLGSASTVRRNGKSVTATGAPELVEAEVFHGAQFVDRFSGHGGECPCGALTGGRLATARLRGRSWSSSGLPGGGELPRRPNKGPSATSAAGHHRVEPRACRSTTRRAPRARPLRRSKPTRPEATRADGRQQLRSTIASAMPPHSCLMAPSQPLNPMCGCTSATATDPG